MPLPSCVDGEREREITVTRRAEHDPLHITPSSAGRRWLWRGAIRLTVAPALGCPHGRPHHSGRCHQMPHGHAPWAPAGGRALAWWSRWCLRVACGAGPCGVGRHARGAGGLALAPAVKRVVRLSDRADAKVNLRGTCGSVHRFRTVAQRQRVEAQALRIPSRLPAPPSAFEGGSTLVQLRPRKRVVDWTCARLESLRDD